MGGLPAYSACVGGDDGWIMKMFRYSARGEKEGGREGKRGFRSRKGMDE